MSKSAIFDKAMDYIDEHIEQSKQEIKEGLYEYLRYNSTKISTFITILLLYQFNLEFFQRQNVRKLGFMLIL